MCAGTNEQDARGQCALANGGRRSAKDQVHACIEVLPHTAGVVIHRPLHTVPTSSSRFLLVQFYIL